MMLKALNPKFILALVIDLFIVTAALYLIEFVYPIGLFLTTGHLILLALYATIHIGLEMLGVG